MSSRRLLIILSVRDKIIIKPWWFDRQISCVFKKGRFGVVKLAQIMLIIEIASANASVSA